MNAKSSHGVRDRMCSQFSIASGEDPCGDAPSWDRCVVIELADPWDSEVQDTKHFPTAVSLTLAAAEERGYPVRLQCIRPDPEYSVDGHTRVMYLEKPDGPMATYERSEFLVRTGDVGGLVETLVERPDDLDEYDGYRQDNSETRDVLVCTHGTRDTCCATFGYPVYNALRDRRAHRENGLRVWQVSHLGGHRLAPNVLDLPGGRYWARLTENAVESLLSMTGPASALKPFYRGWAAIANPFAQVAERAVLMQEDWKWLERRVTVDVSEVDGKDKADVRIGFAGPNGDGGGSYLAQVSHAGTVPTIPCLGTEVDGTVDQYRVNRLVATDAGS